MSPGAVTSAEGGGAHYDGMAGGRGGESALVEELAWHQGNMMELLLGRGVDYYVGLGGGA